MARHPNDRPARALGKRLIASLLAVTVAATPLVSHPADLNAEMQAMFNDLGALGNVTTPGAFRGQAMNLYTGGSLMMRAPGRNYPLASIQLPSLRAGCGGIDIYGGAFSFINKQQFIALLQNIGANAVGYAFKLALQSISPDIDKLLTELQDQINKINAMNINSCEAAQALVNGVVGEYDNSVMSGCANISQYLGSVSDRAEARLTCATNAPAVVKTAANSADPNVRNATFVKGNVTWLALNQVGGSISQQEKELIMSVIGTVILTPPADDGSGATPRYAEPTIVGLRDLLLGRGASATEGNVDIEVYVCDEPAECLNPTRATVSAKPFTRLVADRLHRMSENIATRSPQSPADIGFVNNTTEPVYKMLSVANAVPGSSTAETLIETYKDVIALDYAETFLNRAIRQALSALSQSLKRNGVEQQYVDTIRQNAQEAQRQILAEKQTAYAKVRSVSSMTQDLQTLERQLWSTMPASVKSMLDFSASSGARGS
ncbi:MAG: conjugal transfer protein TraH [Proteobacteria bacterium]|nr:conjugal transfer protein TraH [Pseudomonadota bacterium]